MYINSVNFNIKFKAQKINRKNLNQSKIDVSSEEYLMKLRKIYTEIKKEYKKQDFQKMMAERDKFSSAFENEINQSEQKIPNIEFNI